MYCPEVLTLDPYADASALPCDGCPRQVLHEYLASPAGLLISAVIDLHFALQMGVTVTLDEIPYPAFLMLRHLAEERDKYQAEEARKSSKR